MQLCANQVSEINQIKLVKYLNDKTLFGLLFEMTMILEQLNNLRERERERNAVLPPVEAIESIERNVRFCCIFIAGEEIEN